MLGGRELEFQCPPGGSLPLHFMLDLELVLWKILRFTGRLTITELCIPSFIFIEELPNQLNQYFKGIYRASADTSTNKHENKVWQSHRNSIKVDQRCLCGEVKPVIRFSKAAPCWAVNTLSCFWDWSRLQLGCLSKLMSCVFSLNVVSHTDGVPHLLRLILLWLPVKWGISAVISPLMNTVWQRYDVCGVRWVEVGFTGANWKSTPCFCSSK